MNVTECDLLIVGAGPVGLYASYYAGFRGLRTMLVDSLPEPGGQIAAMYPEKPIYDIAGFPLIKGRDLVARLVEQAGRFNPAYHLGDPATSLATQPDGTIAVGTAAGAVIRCRAVLISGGIGTFTPRPLPAGAEWVGRGLSYFVPDLDAHRDQDVIVVGGGDSACDWALSLEPIARTVTLVHRRTAFRAHDYTVTQLRLSSVEVITDAEITAVSGGERLDTVEITSTAAAPASGPRRPWSRPSGSPRTSGRSAAGAWKSPPTGISRSTPPWRPAFPGCSRPGTSPTTRARFG